MKSIKTIIIFIIFQSYINPFNPNAQQENNQTSSQIDSVTKTLEVVTAWMPLKISINKYDFKLKSGFLPTRTLIGNEEIKATKDYYFIAIQLKPAGIDPIIYQNAFPFNKEGQIGGGIHTTILGWGSLKSKDVVLKDSKEKIYSPVGGIADKDVFFKSQLMKTSDFQLASDDGISLVDTALVYLYEIPKGAKGLKLIINNSQTIPIEVNNK